MSFLISIFFFSRCLRKCYDPASSIQECFSLESGVIYNNWCALRANFLFTFCRWYVFRYRQPCGLGCRSAAARLPGLRVRIPPEAYLSVSCEYCVLSVRRLCDGPIPRLRKFYRFFFCMSVSVIRCHNSPLHLHWVGRRDWTMKERKNVFH